MRKKFLEYKVIVKANFCFQLPIKEQLVYSEDEALELASHLSVQYPTNQVIIEEWKFISSSKTFQTKADITKVERSTTVRQRNEVDILSEESTGRISTRSQADEGVS